MLSRECKVGNEIAGMKSHLIVRIIVESFDNVDFAEKGPVFVVSSPQRGPHSTAHGHVLNVEDEKPMRISPSTDKLD